MLPAASRTRASSACAAIVLLACPVAARGQDAAAPSQALDPNSPMAAMPDLGVDWPDLAQPDAPLGQLPTAPGELPLLAPPPPDLAQSKDKKQAKVAQTTEATGERRYALTIDGLQSLSDAGEIRARFDALSSLQQAASKPANVAQIDRRAREDAGLLADLLRAYGYYDAEVDARVGNLAGPELTTSGDTKLAVTLAVDAGPPYRFTSLSLNGLAGTGEDSVALVRAFGVRKGDAVSADKVNAGIAALKTALGDKGYPFATVADPDITVDHATHEAGMTVTVDPGQRMRFGAFHISGTKYVFGPKHVQLLSRLHPGDTYDAERIEDLRRALIQTGLVSVAQITPVKTADPQVVDLDVHLERAPPRTIGATLGYVTGSRITAGQLGYLNTETVSSVGYGTGQGVTAEVDWTHRNLFPPEGSLTLRGVLGTQEQLASAIFRRNNFRTRDQALVAQLTLDHLNTSAFAAKTVDLAANIERQTNIIWQKKWTYSYGVELVASDERDDILATGEPRRATYYVGAIPLSLSYDGSDDLLNPTKGFRLGARVSPEISFRGRSFEYVRLELNGSAYQPLGRVVFAERIRLGSIQGASADAIAPTRRFYSGGGGSVRGFGYQKIGPRDPNNEPVGGASVAEFGLEARIRFGNFGVVPFFDGGNLYSRSLPKFTGFHYGTGLGVRYYTSFGPIRVDVGTPINREPGDSRVAVYVSLGQAF
ncbi:BamA/TamA family outer membrane protein [Sphingomonas sp. CGMCC 1.13654]|uniref:BamA/TamA family outer membrane protein n=1 Tax=Sphingomonas chungangi TaxID=2683589 RepID=A0A838L2W4_9SPHN|nr:BamA/TamA family outer membrane protein [Sphingomonas chungangi]MBA2932862.1 BamA/TamA family outer membrane protein [Sphingomonas chungangi]MVW56482.1 BamA/TamA family outer membrane protein [Sphingomonas chungangi]